MQPTAGKVFAPADAVITNIAETRHAVGLLTAGGNEILIHIGVVTVKLNGEFFNAHV